MTLRQTELKFQNHIIDSYEKCGGRARKWASEWQKGMPDLICSLPGVGGHLLEVKHRPEFGPMKRIIKNPLEPKQRDEAKKYIEAGCAVFVAIIACETLALKSRLLLFDPLADLMYYNEEESVPYEPGKGYYVRGLIEEAIIGARNG